MALIAIVYVIQAFRIPTGSMEDSLKVGDFLLGLKFVYGSPLFPYQHDLGVTARFPRIRDPRPGDVIIFKYPGTGRLDYIKRCVAGPGQTVQIHDTTLLVDGKALTLPPRGKFQSRGRSAPPEIVDFALLRIPARGDTLRVDSLPVREFLFLKHLVQQERPNKKVRIELQLYVNGEFANDRVVSTGQTGVQLRFRDVVNSAQFPRFNGGRSDLNAIDNWVELDRSERGLLAAFPNDTAEIRQLLYLDGKRVTSYVVQRNNYFMMGDNRDNSADSRYWGCLNDNFVKAKAFILYFSLDSDVSWALLPLKIRWNRIGRLIRSWDGSGG
jgi:signal peptidase I